MTKSIRIRTKIIHAMTNGVYAAVVENTDNGVRTGVARGLTMGSLLILLGNGKMRI